MKIIEILHTVFILYVSTFLAFSILLKAQRMFFGSEITYYIHIAVCLLLILIALLIIFSHFKLKSKVKIFQIAWWIPQLFVIFLNSNVTISPESYSLYFMPYPFFVPLKFVWTRSSEESIAIALNLAPLIAIGINVFLEILSNKKEKRNYSPPLFNKKEEKA